MGAFSHAKAEHSSARIVRAPQRCLRPAAESPFSLTRNGPVRNMMQTVAIRMISGMISPTAWFSSLNAGTAGSRQQRNQNKNRSTGGRFGAQLQDSLSWLCGLHRSTGDRSCRNIGDTVNNKLHVRSDNVNQWCRADADEQAEGCQRNSARNSRAFMSSVS